MHNISSDQLFDLTVGPPVGVYGIIPEYSGRPAEDAQVTVMPNGVTVASIDTGSPLARYPQYSPPVCTV